MDAETLSTLLTAILIQENSPSDASASLKVLSKVVSNALAHPDDPKFRTLPGTNETVKARVRQTAGALEFLDAIGWAQLPNGDLTLETKRAGSDISGNNDKNNEKDWMDKLRVGQQAITLALATLDSAPPTSAATSSVRAASSNKASPPTAGVGNGGTGDDWQSKAALEAEARAREIAKRAEEDRKRKELVKKQIAAEQKEARDRPVRSSVATPLVRASAQGGSAGGGGGKVRHVSSDSEYQKLVSGGQPVIVNYTVRSFITQKHTTRV